MFLSVRRATVLMPTPYDGKPNSKHLFIYLTDPDPNAGEVLIVSISSIVQNKHWDTACKLSPGCHSFIKRESYVKYDTCKIVSAASIEQKVKSGELIAKETMPAGEFAYILKGLEESRFVAPKFLNFFKQNSLH